MDAQEFLACLADATNAHDVEGIVACFARDYSLTMPCHPARDFVGTDQVKRNWTGMFAAVPDLTVEVLRVAVRDDVVWSEWEMTGTRVDGATHLLRGVIVFDVDVPAGRARAARFFVEPVDRGGMDADEAIAAVSGVSS